MNNEDEIQIHSRAELIRLARQDCERRLQYTSRGLQEDTEVEKRTELIPHQEIRQEYLRHPVSQQFTQPNHSAMQDNVGKLLAIRYVVAILLLLTIVVVDQLNLGEGVFSKENMRQQLSKNTTIEAMEATVASFLGDAVLPAFQSDTAPMEQGELQEQIENENQQDLQQENVTHSTQKPTASTEPTAIPELDAANVPVEY